MNTKKVSTNTRTATIFTRTQKMKKSGRSKLQEGPYLFSFDQETIFNFWTDYPDKLTPEQIEIFKKENPVMAALK